jgi:hypothetical protein
MRPRRPKAECKDLKRRELVQLRWIDLKVNCSLLLRSFHSAFGLRGLIKNGQKNRASPPIPSALLL